LPLRVPPGERRGLCARQIGQEPKENEGGAGSRGDPKRIRTAERQTGPLFFRDSRTGIRDDAELAMTLTDEQKTAVASWLEAGAGLSEVQKRLREEFQISLTYLDTRFLVDDLKITIKDPEPEPKPIEPEAAEPPPLPPEENAAPPPPDAGGRVQVDIDQIMQPGTMISGKVTFTDGEKAAWYLDQTGRLGLNADTPGYRPTEKDVLAFQMELQRLARTQGY